MSAPVLRVVHAPSAVVTDLGRRRGPHYGVPSGGALDRRSASIANVLAGNAPDAPVIEVTAFDLELVAGADVLIAVAGAPMTLRVDEVVHPLGEPVSVRAGQTVTLRDMSAGLRTYLAVHGSFDVPRLLGSCAPDTVLGFGSRLADGDELAVRTPVPPIVNPHFRAPLYRLDARAVVVPTDPVVVDVTDGPDVHEFGDTVAHLFKEPYTVGAASNHIGLRLSGRMPQRQVAGEVLSRGVPVGAVEAPPGHELLVLHRGRGVTAGYPVLAVVTATSLDTLAQVRPGSRVSFRHVGVDQAVAAARAERSRLVALQHRTASVFAALGFPSLSSLERNCR